MVSLEDQISSCFIYVSFIVTTVKALSKGPKRNGTLTKTDAIVGLRTLSLILYRATTDLAIVNEND